MLLFVNWFKLGLILKNIKDTSPDVVIINGPFLPINNEILIGLSVCHSLTPYGNGVVGDDIDEAIFKET